MAQLLGWIAPAIEISVGALIFLMVLDGLVWMVRCGRWCGCWNEDGDGKGEKETSQSMIVSLSPLLYPRCFCKRLLSAGLGW
jgi:hypothetical protein